jgi:hypothetical protein
MALTTRLLATLAFGFLMGMPSSALAVPVGVFAFDALGGGLNTFSLTNLSGAFGLPPDFPVMVDASLLDVHVELESATGPLSVDLGDVGPGPFGDPAGVLVFPDSVLFTSARLTATLAPASLTLYDGSRFDALTAIVAELLPASGGVLQAGLDLVIVDARPVPDVPEPATFLLVAAALAAGAVRATRQR